MEKAGFFTRFVAYVLDGFLIGILAWLVGLLLIPLLGIGANSDSSFIGALIGGATFLVFVVLLLFQFFYFGYFWSKGGKSLGMKLVNIKVVRQSEGESLSFLRAGLRGTFGYWISGFIFGLGYLWAIFDANNETWHDKIFDTWVVKD